MACRRVALRFDACKGGAVHQFVGAFAGDAEVIARAFEAREGIGGVGLEDFSEPRGGPGGDQAEVVAGQQLGETGGVGEGATGHAAASLTCWPMFVGVRGSPWRLHLLRGGVTVALPS